MGEAAEIMLDGTVCEGCGEVFDDIIEGAEPPGHPRRCGRLACEPEISLMRALRTSLVPTPSAAAKRNARHNRERREFARQRKPFECHCGKLFRTERGMQHHARDVHGQQSQQGGAARSAREAHNLEVAGSNPAPATILQNARAE